MGDTEMRSGFTLLRSVSDKNAYRIFTGGNHTWILLDEFIPQRKNARLPSPLEGERVKLFNHGKPKKRKTSNERCAEMHKAKD